MPNPLQLNQFFESEDPLALLHNAVLPWFAAHPPLSTPSSTKKLNAVLAPDTPTLTFLKSQLALHNIPAFNIHFLTPSKLRSIFSQHLNLPPSTYHPLREDLYLLLQTTASEFPNNPYSSLAQKKPQILLTALDILETHGWSAHHIDDPHARQILHAFTQKSPHWLTPQRIEKKCFQVNLPLLFNHTLIYGFHAHHLSYLNLLRLIIESSSATTLTSLQLPNQIDLPYQLWVSTFENLLGPSQQLFLPNLSSPASPQIILSTSPQNEALSLFHHILDSLQSTPSPRIAIAFPNEASPVARELASLLHQSQIHFQDEIGHFPYTSSSLLDYLSFHLTPRLPQLQNFLKSLFLSNYLSHQTYSSWLRSLNDAQLNLLTQDAYTLLSWLPSSLTSPLAPILSHFPDSAPLDYFESTLSNALTFLSPSLAPSLLQKLSPLHHFSKTLFKKDFFIPWLTSQILSINRTTNSSGDHPLAPIHLLTYQRALPQSWTHIFLPSLHDDSDSSFIQETPFLPSPLIDRLNSQILEPSRHGLGQDSIKRSHSFLLSNAYHALHQNQALHALALSPSPKITLSTHLYPNLDLSSPLKPHPLIIDTCESLFPDSPVQSTLHALALSNAEQLLSLNNPSTPSPSPQSSTPLPELTSSNTLPPSLSAKQWEELLSSPLPSWIKHVAAISFPYTKECTSLRPVALGTWVHNWLAIDHIPMSNNQIDFHAFKSAVHSKAFAFYHKVKSTFASAHKPLPDSWSALFSKAYQATLRLIDNLQSLPLPNSYQVHTEFSIPPSLVTLPSTNYPLTLHGRIDLLILDSTSNSSWIIDYKTGSSLQSLSTSQLSKNFKGLQLPLYGLLLESQNLPNPHLTLISSSPATPPSPLPLRETFPLDSLWSTLTTAHQSLSFPNSINEDSFSPPLLPFSTLPFSSQLTLSSLP